MSSPTRSSSHLSPSSTLQPQASQSTSTNPPPPPTLQHVTSEDSVVTAEIAVDDDLDPESAINLSRSFTRGFRRASVATGTHPLHLLQGSLEDAFVEPSPQERAKLIKQEKSLLKDNNLMPSSGLSRKRSRSRDPSVGPSKFLRKVSSAQDDNHLESGAAEPATETTGLLSDSQLDPEYGAITPVPTADEIDRQFTTAVLAGLIKTSWRRELKVLARSSAPLMLTFVLQYSLHMTSIFVVGHIGTSELGAVSVGSMTASITGWSVFQGCVTALDTLCSQAYGAGNKQLVGLHMQRMMWFLLCLLVPIGIFWLNAGWILTFIVPERRTAELAGLYLRIILLGAPGNILYECGKRYLMCQGVFDPILYVLLVCAPFNVLLNYLFVWVFKWGFIGSPIATAVTYNLLPLCLLFVCMFTKGRECWGGFSFAAFRNWGPMVGLATSGLIMLVAEWLAFELLTLAASYLSGAHLAAQSILSTIAGLTFQLPFAISVAASTRIANLIGATLSDAAKLSARVAFSFSLVIGFVNSALLFSTRSLLPGLFTSDKEVSNLVFTALPICVAFQLFDASASVCNGMLRGIGRQEIGGYFNLVGYYAFALPLSFMAAFWWNWGLIGLWIGPALTLALLSVAEGYFIFRTSWEKAVEDAQKRNAMG